MSNYKIFSHFSANSIQLVSFPFTNELAMEAYIWENPEILKLSDDDRPEIHGIEVKWSRGDKGGRIDILASYNDKTLAIVELKRGELNHDHFTQLKEYFLKTDYTKNVSVLGEIMQNPTWIGVLVGTGITPALKKEVENGLKILDKIPVAVVILNRFKGENQSFIISDTIRPKLGKDYSKYSLKGVGSYYKNRLVLAFMQQFILDHPDISYEEAAGIFKGKVHFIKSKPLLKSYEDAVNDGSYFIKPDELVKIRNFEYAVLNWWSIEDMQMVSEVAGSLGYTVKRIKSS